MEGKYKVEENGYQNRRMERMKKIIIDFQDSQTFKIYKTDLIPTSK